MACQNLAQFRPALRTDDHGRASLKHAAIAGLIAKMKPPHVRHRPISNQVQIFGQLGRSPPGNSRFLLSLGL